MRLTVKFNLVLLGVLSVGLLISGALSYTILQENARQEIIERASIMMEAAEAKVRAPPAVSLSARIPATGEPAVQTRSA